MIGLNPVTLKELRQHVRSKLILWALILYPIALLVLSGCILSAELNSASSHSADPALKAYDQLMVTAGPSLRTGTLSLFGFLSILVIPFFTGLRLARESSRGRMDLQFTTALTAQDVVSGKLMAALLTTLTFGALSLPFLTLAYLMRGLDLGYTVLGVLGVIAAALVSSAVAVFLGSLRMTVGRRIALLVLAYLMFGFYALVGTVVAVADLGGKHSTSAPLWAIMLMATFVVLSLVALARAWAASNLMPEYTDHQRALRKLELVLVGVTLLVALVGGAVTDNDDFAAVAVVIAVALIVNSAWSLFLPPGVTRVVAAHAPRGLLRRLLSFPFATTAASGAVFSLALLLVSLAVAVLTLCLTGDADDIGNVHSALVSIFGEVMLVASLLAMAFRACRVKRSLYAQGPVIVGVIFAVLQAASILEATNVIAEADFCFGYFAGVGNMRSHAYHLVYGLLGLFVYLPFLALETKRSFAAYRPPEEVAA